MIREVGILNETVKPRTFAFGIPNPGTYVLDRRGVVVSRYFEDDYRERVSASDILAQQVADHDGGKHGDAAAAGADHAQG